ncbi:MAG: hypothetical protein ACOYI4_03145 [Christensenellales bacterium]
MQKNSIYSDFILKNAPRVITQVDRDPHSTTYGSCDRNYWHLKIRDFNSAILQQSGLTLALLYQLDFPGNIYYNNQNVAEWAKATVRFWSNIQLKDGSYNEYYPWEHGFPPTAFSLYSSSQVYSRLQMDEPDILEKMKKTARYLCKTIEEKAFNQEMASIAALYSVYTLVQEQWILDGCRAKLNRILQHQSPEGWFSEYGGADLGYLSVALDMLCEYYHLSGDEAVKEPIAKVIDFIKYFVHPDGTVGGEYGSRNTTYFLPSGLEVALQIGIADAGAIKEKLYSNTAAYNYFMDSVDDRYFSHYLLHSFLRALEKEQLSPDKQAGALLPYQSGNTRYFPKSGLLSLHNDVYSAFVGLQKGGVVKLYEKEKELFIDCGYRVNYGKGTIAATNWQDPSYEWSFEGTNAKVYGSLNKISLKVSRPILHMGLRVVSFIMGNKIIGFLKKKLIFVDRHTNITFSREIQFAERTVTLTDHLNSPTPVDFEYAGTMSLRHVASGKFFMTADLLAQPRLLKGSATEATVITKYNMDTGQAERVVQ